MASTAVNGLKIHNKTVTSTISPGKRLKRSVKCTSEVLPPQPLKIKAKVSCVVNTSQYCGVSSLTHIFACAPS